MTLGRAARVAFGAVRRLRVDSCAVAFVIVLSSALLMACQPRRVDPFEAPDPELATEEVAVLPTDGLSPDADAKDRRASQSANQLMGRLPSSFPADLPVFRPASVTDFSNPNEVPRMVELTVGRSTEQVSSYYARELEAQGWREASSNQWQKDGRRVELAIKSVGGGETVVKILY